MSGVRVSVVVPVLDMAGTIGACLDALTSQSYPRALTDVIVVDNGSTDGTCAVVEKYPVRLLAEATRGAPAARNRGVAAATGELVAFTDADCVPTRTWLARLVATAASQQVDVVAGGTSVLDPSVSLLARYSARIGQYDPAATMWHPRYPYACTANVAIRRALLEDSGGFDPAFTTYDAAELFWRLSRSVPIKVAVDPRAMVFYRTRPTVAALARQNYRYGLGYARFCLTVPEVAAVIAPLPVARRWLRRVSLGLAQLSADGYGWREALGLRALHLVRETALAAGTIAGHRRYGTASGS